MRKKEVGVIGLGKFGSQLGATLGALGHEVIGLDSDDKKVQLMSHVFSAAYQGDATDKNVLEQLRFQDLDCVVVSIGHSMETSILISLNLKDLGADDITVKVISSQHKTVMERLGVTKVILPEQEAAIQTAYRINNPGMLDLLPIAGGTLLQSFVVDKWRGKTLAELSLPSRSGVIVVAIKKETEDDFFFVPDAHRILEAGESLLVIGPRANVLEMKP